jgi:hypothetical protein
MNDLLKFMHDTMGDTARIKGCINLLKRGELTEEEKVMMLDAIETSNEHLVKVLDSYYVDNFKPAEKK